MAEKTLQFRRKTQTERLALTPANGELIFDTTNNRFYVGNGSTAGGLFAFTGQKDIQNQVFNSGTAGGTANALTLTLSSFPITSYVAYQSFTFKASATNTGSATINIDGLGVKTIKQKTSSGATSLVGGEIVLNQVYTVVYDGTDFQLSSTGSNSKGWVLLNQFTFTGQTNTILDLDADYDTFVFILEDLRIATRGARVKFNVFDATTTLAWDKITSTYVLGEDGQATPTYTQGITANNTTAHITRPQQINEGVSGEIYLYNYKAGSEKIHFKANTVFTSYNEYVAGNYIDFLNKQDTAGITATTTAPTRAGISSNAIGSGRITMYGINNTP